MTTLTNTALTFGGTLYMPKAPAERTDIVGLDTLTGPELVKMYNELAFELGTAEVKRFSDTKSAVKRTWAQMIAWDAAKPETPALDAAGHENGSVESIQAWADGKRQAAAPAPAKPAAAKTAETAPAVQAKRSIWRRAKHENASKIAYRPEAGTVQAQLYDILTRSPDGILMEDYCTAAAQVKTKDATLFTPSSVWGALRYLFVTNRGYGLDFDGARLKLLVPADERQSSRKLKQG